jgi:hypothetical protein
VKQARKQRKIEHLYKAIAIMRSEQGHNTVKEQAQRVVEILKRDYGVSVPDSLRRMVGRRIKEFNAANELINNNAEGDMRYGTLAQSQHHRGLPFILGGALSHVGRII